MEFKVEGYQYNLSCQFKDNQILAEGPVWCSQSSEVSLRFPVGAVVEVEFNRKKTKAKIEKFTKNNQVVLSISETQKKKVDIQTLVSDNRFTEICYRIENKEGEGPYQSKTTTPRLMEWRSSKRNQYEAERNYGMSHLHPTAENDPHLKDYVLASTGLFGFNSLDQMKKWFTPEDLQLLADEGFSIAVKQKGLDYFGSFYSSKQMVIALTEEDYNKIMSSYRTSYY